MFLPLDDLFQLRTFVRDNLEVPDDAVEVSRSESNWKFEKFEGLFTLLRDNLFAPLYTYAREIDLHISILKV